MAWNSAMTNAAIEMWNQVPTGESIHLDYAAGGAGTVSSAALMAQTELAQKRQVFSIVDIKAMDGGQRVNIQIDNSGLEEGYVLRQIGIWGHLTNSDPQMIAILQDEDDHGGINIPAEAEVADFSLNFYALLKVSGDSEITLEIESTALVSMATLEETLNGYAKADHTHERFDRVTIGDRLENYTGAIDGLTVGDNNIASGVGVTAMGRQNIALYGSVFDIMDVDVENNVLTLDLSIGASRIGKKAILWATAANTLPAEVEILAVDETGKVITVSKFSGDYQALVLPAEQSSASKIFYSGHAEGSKTVAAGQHGSHAEGTRTIASGVAAHAEGNYSRALGGASHAEGTYTTARSANQHVQGKYNIPDTAGTYAHIVGNGTADNNRNNAHTLDWEGNAWYSGNIQSATYGSMSTKKRYATVVIGTTTHGHTLADCDYLCDGTDDQVEIQAAINSVTGTNEGGSVVFLEGTYRVASQVTVKLDQVSITISGQGSETVILDVNSSNANHMVFNLTGTYPKYADPSTCITVENISFGIAITAVHNANTSCILCNSSKTVIKNCTFKELETAIAVEQSIVSTGNSAYVSKYGTWTLIQECLFYGCGYGVRESVYSSTRDYGYTVIQSNIFYCTQSSGYSIAVRIQEGYAQIVNNTMIGDNGVLTAIQISKGSVIGNTIVGVFAAGVSVLPHTYKSEDNSILSGVTIGDNVISGKINTAISITPNSEGIPIPVAITGNAIRITYVAGTGSTKGIVVANNGAPDQIPISISNNAIHGVSRAIDCSNINDTIARNVRVSIVGNCIEEHSYGVYVNGMNYPVIVGNFVHIIGNVSSGISVYNCNKASVTGNVVQGDSTNGRIQFLGCDTATVTGNITKEVALQTSTNILVDSSNKYY